MTAGQPEEPLTEMPEDRILSLMAHHLRQRTEHPVGSKLWALAVLDYEECAQELHRRLLAHVVGEIRRREES